MQRNILAAIIFAFAFFLLFVLVLPQYDAIKIAKDAIKSRQALLDERTALLGHVSELDSQAESRQSDIDKIKVFIPAKKQIDEVVSSIQKITEQSGIQLSVLSTSEASGNETKNYKSILISMDIAGTYPAFINFLKLLEQSLRLYDISGITAAASTTTLGQINFAVKMNAYYLK